MKRLRKLPPLKLRKNIRLKRKLKKNKQKKQRNHQIISLLQLVILKKKILVQINNQIKRKKK